MFRRSIELYFQKYADFKSQTTLNDFYPVALVLIIVNFLGDVIVKGFHRFSFLPLDGLVSLAFGLLTFALIIPTIALFVRRFSNVGFSWRLLVVLMALSVIPFFGWFARVIIILISIQPAGFARNVNINLGNTTWYKK